MNTTGLIIMLSILFFSLKAQQKQPVDYADPLMGTSESRWMLNPGSTLPFAMVQLSPDNQGNQWKSGYEYNIASVAGFSHIHSWISYLQRGISKLQVFRNGKRIDFFFFGDGIKA